MDHKTLVPAALVAVALAGAATLASAQDRIPMGQPYILLTQAQAVTIAEATTSGHVTKVKLAGGQADSYYKLKVATAPNESMRMRIAAVGGKVLSSEKDGQRHRN